MLLDASRGGRSLVRRPEARRTVEPERGGTAHRIIAFRPSSPVAVEDVNHVGAAERLLVDLFGAIRIM